MSVRFRVLGPVAAVTADGRPLPLTGGRQRLLLVALLAQAGEVVSADRLADLLWAPTSPTTRRRRSTARSRGCGACCGPTAASWW
jgi:DNA-binding SARP family transcriptional activator